MAEKTIMILDNIRFYITEACNSRCPNCFNRDNRREVSMDINRFESLCKFFSAKDNKQIKIMGGEPTIHPSFGAMMKIAQYYFESVSLFTNAISDKLLEFIPREKDIVTYNFRFSKLLTEKKLLLDKPGLRNLEIQITQNINKEKLVDEIISVTSINKDRIRPCLTLDCTSDIFQYKSDIANVYEYVWSTCLEKGIIMGQDHLIPLCFLEGTRIPVPKGGSRCNLSCAGLIDSECNLHYCNQYYEDRISIFKDSNEIISDDELSAFLMECHDKMLKVNGAKGCSTCPLFLLLCNGGCFMGKDCVSNVKSPF